jgi:hypothetical protein
MYFGIGKVVTTKIELATVASVHDVARVGFS